MNRIRDRRFKSTLALALAAPLALTGCDGGKGSWRHDPGGSDTERSSPQAGYLTPPRAVSAVLQADGVELQGEAAPQASVRLGSPTGEALVGRADADGRWRLRAPPAAAPRLFGLSMTLEGRTVQAQGYVMITPEGKLVLLRAGAGAEVTATASDAPRILAVDYDRSGGGVISGVAAPGAGLGVRVDRAPRAEGKADEAGRFTLSLNQALKAGVRTIQVAGEGGEQQVDVEVAPPAPPTGGPVRTTRTPIGWRVDWMTPGGGVQTTQLVEGGAR
ncbi:hypothetical protein [Caulobacter sp.]|uniref:hypothetical protein n=1 Tax=Caulobacter sp. TaxID=78 RepID=UPI001B296E43|nr:hypothetical protein [Caulobacter sp.]MBO9545410.1 hypothetical protein [Caulobacter sp.]